MCTNYLFWSFTQNKLLFRVIRKNSIFLSQHLFLWWFCCWLWACLYSLCLVLFRQYYIIVACYSFSSLLMWRSYCSYWYAVIKGLDCCFLRFLINVVQQKNDLYIHLIYTKTHLFFDKNELSNSFWEASLSVYHLFCSRSK